MPPRTLKLFCLVLNDKPSLNNIFSVVILETASISTLKERIKEKKQVAFRDIDAQYLELWDVSIFVKGLSDADLPDLLPKRSPLIPNKRLEDLFLDTPPKGAIHIIVRPPGIIAPPVLQSLLVLNCLVLGESNNHIFPVEIASTKSVGSLKEAIKEKKSRLFNRVDADDLALWNVSELDDLNLEKANFLVQESLSPVDELSKVFPNSPVRGCLHIVIGHPADHGEQEGFAPPLKRARNTTTGDGTDFRFIMHLRDKYKSQTTLPSVEELRAFMHTPLAESEKIPITQVLFNDFLSTRVDDICTEADVSAVFKIGDGGANAQPFRNIVGTPRSYRTKAGYHHCWDTNIGKVLEALIPEGDAERNANYYAETRKARPDFAFLIRERCVFRGEEKGPTSAGNPEVELTQKLKWAYDSAPYILGYYAYETSITFVAIVHENGETRRIDLESINLKCTVDRIFNIRRLINICSILHRLADMVHEATPEFL